MADPLQSPQTTVNSDSDHNDIEVAIRRAIKRRPRDIGPPKQPVASSQPPTGLALLAQSNQPNNCTFDAATCEFRSGSLTFKTFLANPKQNKKSEVTALERDMAKNEARVKDIVLKPKAAEPPQSSTRKRSLKRSLPSVDDLLAIQKSSHKKSFLSIDHLESATQKPSHKRSFLSVDDLEAPIQPPQSATQKPSLKRSFLSVGDLEETPIIPTTTSDASRHGRIKRHKRDDRHHRHLSSRAAIPDRDEDLSLDSLAARKRHADKEKAGRDNRNHHHHKTSTTAASARIGSPSLDKDISRAFPESQVARENFEAIKHAPTTAGAKAKTRLDELRKAGTGGDGGGAAAAAAGRPAANPTIPQSAEDLFHGMIANHDKKQPKTRIVNNLPSGDRQKEATNRRPQGARPDVSFTLLRRSGKKNSAVNPTARAGVPRSQQAFNAAPTVSSGGKNGKAPAVVRTNIFQQQQRYRPVVPPPVPAPRRPGSGLKAPYHHAHQAQDDNEEEEEYAQSPPAPAVIPPPQNVAQAEELLGGDRIVRNWVVYRTAKSKPETTAVTGSATGGGKAICCSDFLSKAAANTQAQILHDRAKKGVVDKTWSRAGPEGLFRGTL
ncbi:hypothetical protein B0T26DRAFT_233296 [Lasiosphaeria miniovina]|uniref:Uncharacterized protein n=1 Tax=Lasiosphaeria miniovina TaxID=1954250 RepID=A0AA40AVL8_9PEZI|nr:uncharacterized protein B0T26DRAFT_233296 [Lasiosphaeria miniovina]KAK0722786.1 hypothetical protein B0T26DRAFT_233296 [Lasiosphaeria miniovina]